MRAMLGIDLTGKRALVAGVADDGGYGFAIAKALAEAGASVCVGTWPPALNIFETLIRRGKIDESRKLARDFGDGPCLDILVHSLANGPEVKKPLLETSRGGYLAAVGVSAYSLTSMVQRLGPRMRPGSSVVSLSYLAAERVIPGYGGGMSSAKAALESDTRTLAYEAGRKWGMRVNTISAGPLASRAASAIGMIEEMVKYYKANAALPQELTADELYEVVSRHR